MPFAPMLRRVVPASDSMSLFPAQSICAAAGARDVVFTLALVPEIKACSLGRIEAELEGVR